MKFLADVNIPQSVIFSLRENGHDVLDIKEKSVNLKDSEIVSIAQFEKLSYDSARKFCKVLSI
jgi:hypothetical protein